MNLLCAHRWSEFKRTGFIKYGTEVQGEYRERTCDLCGHKEGGHIKFYDFQLHTIEAK